MRAWPDGVRVAILGGGPAGAFCAVSLLGMARRRRLPVEVTIFDRKPFSSQGPAGCNMCAGVISASLIARMEEMGISVPLRVVQREVAGYRLIARGGTVRIPKPPGARIFTAFRGSGPRYEQRDLVGSFDEFLLEQAVQAGAGRVNAMVRQLSLPAGPEAPFLIESEAGRHQADIVVGAFGVNSRLAGVFEGLGIGYRAPRTISACQAEMPVEPEFIERELRGDILIFALGWKRLRFVALTPKQHHLTVTLVGEEARQCDLEQVLADPVVRSYLPPGWELPERYCHCHPQLPVTEASHPFADRLLVIGDANISRYLKNGIESALITADLAARAIINRQWSRGQLRQHFLRPCHQRYRWDNRCGQALFRLHDWLSQSRLITEAHISEARRELARGDRSSFSVNRVLWDMFTGDAGYRDILKRMLSPGLGLKFSLSAARSLGTAAAASIAGRKPVPDPIPHPESPIPNPVPAQPLGPLGSGNRVVIIGGGPAGAGCALALAQESARMGRGVQVVLLEPKHFGEHFNQCAGVLSPPLLDILQGRFDLSLPTQMIQRTITGYVLHSSREAVILDGGGREISHSIRRVALDDFLLEACREAGVQVVAARANDVEIHQDHTVVYTESGTFWADAVVGAWGADPGISATFAQRTGYRPPRCLETMVTKLHPAGLDFIPGLLEDRIHVFLPSLPRVDFGALIPKGNHITVILAGSRLEVSDMQAFLDLPAVAAITSSVCDVQGYFKGRFPLGPAGRSFGDRFVVIGDAAGLVRPFKGKGINAALLTGSRAAAAMLEDGVSRAAFGRFYHACADLHGDFWYGRAIRALAHLFAKHLPLDLVVTQAEREPALREFLFDSVSGRETYRHILRRWSNLGMALRVAARLMAG